MDPDACPQVITAAFTVLREMVLRSDADDAPRQLARLGAAHRTLADPARRAAHDAGIAEDATPTGSERARHPLGDGPGAPAR